jgi:hypothetical protein
MSSHLCMLLAPPLPPVRVEAGAEVVLGRSPECALALPSAQASRRHASVRRDGDRVLVRDLGSTNGTFVNGERVTGERALASGDRIDVGGTTVTFWNVGRGAPAPAPADRTIVAFQPESPTAVSEALGGDLSQIPLFAVLQMLEMGTQSGVLTVTAADGVQRIWLASGRLVHAETEKLRGVEAALAVAQATAGRFEFQAGEPAPTRSMQSSVTEIVLEASRLLDEARASG